MTIPLYQHFGLTHMPFAKASPTLWQDEAFLALQTHFHRLLATPGIALLTGEPGVGKTAALREITKSLNPHQHHVFYIAETNFTSFDIYRQIALNLGLVPAHRFAQLWRDIKHNIRERFEQKRSLPIFIIDEAQNLPLTFFRDFPAFVNFNFDAKDMMSVWLVGHPILNTIIHRQAYIALASRIPIHYHMQAIFERERFQSMLAFVFKEAGCQSVLLSDSGIELLRIASAGRPRDVHKILYNAMALAVSRNLNHLPDDLLQQAITQLKS